MKGDGLGLCESCGGWRSEEEGVDCSHRLWLEEGGFDGDELVEWCWFPEGCLDVVEEVK